MCVSFFAEYICRFFNATLSQGLRQSNKTMDLQYFGIKLYTSMRKNSNSVDGMWLVHCVV